MKSSIIITSFNRPHLLSFGLASIADQGLSKDELEVIVLNDGDPNDGTDGVCELFDDELNIRYFNAQHRTEQWRVPGFAVNFGVRQAAGENIFISCAEMYHLDKSIPAMVQVLEKNSKSLVIHNSGRDDNGLLLKKLKAGKTINDHDYNNLELLHNIHLPFFMGMKKCEFVNIGGYDEDFRGVGFDDNDIVHRLNAVGNCHVRVPGRVVHLYHQRLAFRDPTVQSLFKKNNKLFEKRKNIIIRNVGVDWGNSF